jgi:hypothetical protein
MEYGGPYSHFLSHHRTLLRAGSRASGSHRGTRREEPLIQGAKLRRLEVKQWNAEASM